MRMRVRETKESRRLKSTIPDCRFEFTISWLISKRLITHHHFQKYLKHSCILHNFQSSLSMTSTTFYNHVKTLHQVVMRVLKKLNYVFISRYSPGMSSSRKGHRIPSLASGTLFPSVGMSLISMAPSLAVLKSGGLGCSLFSDPPSGWCQASSSITLSLVDALGDRTIPAHAYSTDTPQAP